MGLNAILLFLTFSTLTIVGLLNHDGRERTLSRSLDEWTVDLSGLFIQGVIIPAFPFLMVPLLSEIFPFLSGKLDLPWLLQILISFVLIDYLYYWNHRIFHRKNLWHIHRLHHSSRSLDVFATSRNSLITSFLFVYVWAQILGMFLLRDSLPFMLGLGLTYALDLWRHSGIQHSESFNRFVGQFLILPQQHVLHHSLQGRNKNYGANFNVWDKLHGTYSNEYVQNKNLEKISGKNIWKELIFPGKAAK